MMSLPIEILEHIVSFLPDTKERYIASKCLGLEYMAQNIVKNFARLFDFRETRQDKYIMKLNDWYTYYKNTDWFIKESIQAAVDQKRIDIMDWWLGKGEQLRFNGISLIDAAKNGHLEVFKWYQEHNLIMWYMNRIINCLCKYGHVRILQWLKDNDILRACYMYNNKYNIKAMDVASANGQVNVLDWWFKSGLKPLRYSENAISSAFDNDHGTVLKWWIESGLDIQFSKKSLAFNSLNLRDKIKSIFIEAFRNGNLDMMQKYADMHLPLPQKDDSETWLRNKIKFLNNISHGIVHTPSDNFMRWLEENDLDAYLSKPINIASMNGDIDVLNWWKNSGLDLCYSFDSIDHAHNIEVLDWWKNSGLALCYTYDAMNKASNIEVLDWWKNSGLALRYSIDALINASRNNDIEILNWWKQSGLKFKYYRTEVAYVKHANWIMDNFLVHQSLPGKDFNC